MPRKFDFLIDKWEGFDKKILRFYPKQSSVHGFTEVPPRNWREVYKTYMTFSILHYYENDDCPGLYEMPISLFHYRCDEGEGLRYLRDFLFDLINEPKHIEYEITPFGDGVDWEIYSDKRNPNYYVFTLINNQNGQCYRFRLDIKEVENLYNVLNEFLEYMLKHSVGI